MSKKDKKSKTNNKLDKSNTFDCNCHKDEQKHMTILLVNVIKMIVSHVKRITIVH